DTYFVDNVGDVVQETGFDNDTVRTTLAAYTLTSGVEVLIYDGAGNFAGTGNSLANTIAGGDGDDVLDGKAGADVLVGGQGQDFYLVDNAGDLVVEQAGHGYDTLQSSVDYGLGAGVSIEEMLAAPGTGGIDLTGNELANAITGNAGANILNGGDGDDLLAGGAGNDLLSGGAGDDVLNGGVGTDQMTGGAGADIFVFNAMNQFSATATLDLIVDFHTAEGDKIDLSGLDADSGASGDQAFHLLGTRAFTGHAGDLRYDISHGTATVYGDVNGDGVADFAFRMSNTASLAAGDFYL
ncbi:MAG: hypothetical protein JWM33_4018, partial [Caulobacteraceae bacterium]|nr:hypothetical protein [Caulobacteraceae bacterium]